ncbi:MAG: hypothetical protein ACI3ZF_01000 [Candidatus Cryptobacteroides sp.]
MKKTYFSLIIGGLFALLASSCQQETNVTSKPSVSLGNVTAELLTAEVSLTTQGLTEYAYLVAVAGEELTDDPVVIFATGTTGTLVDGENKIIVRDLIPETEQQIVIAFKTSETEFYPQVLAASFTTTEYTETLTIVKTAYDGLTIHFKVPQSVKDAGNAIRYNIGSLPMYLRAKNGWFSQLDADMLLLNAQQHMLGDTTLVYNTDNIYEEVYDPWEDGIVEKMRHTPFVPGEPVIIMAGEFSWDDTNFTGWGNGYYNALFDFDTYYEEVGGGGFGPLAVDVDTPSDEDKYWTGYFCRKTVVLPGPEDFDAKLDINVQLNATTGTLSITPGDNVPMFCYLFVPDYEYEMILPLIDNNEDYLQWLITSYFGAAYLYAGYSSDALNIVLEDEYYLEAETKYHLLVTAFGNTDGTVQHFFHETYTTSAKTEKAPEIVVTALENKTIAYEAWFNVKCTSKNAVSAKYAANYVREFGMMLNNGYSYENLANMGNSFSPEEVALINSDEGLDLRFTSVPNSTTRLVVLASNSEDTANTIEEDGTALADVTTLKEDPKDKVDSPLFSELLGDWTATAFLSQTGYYYDEDGNYVNGTIELGERSRKISISTGYTYPETLPESVYDLYATIEIKREEVDALYEEFKHTVDEFNAALVGQNRLLCTGFGYETEWEDYNDTYYTENSPFDLFVSDSYNGYDVESMIWDCGPKFYLEIKPDGTVVLPINDSRFYPLTLATYYTLYPIGIGADGFISQGPDGENADFPVSVSEDYKTLTIGQYVYNDQSYVLNAAYFSWGYAYVAGAQILSDIVLTKGWTEPEVPAATVKTNAAPSENRLKLEAVDGMNASKIVPLKSKTALKADRQMKTVVYTPLNLEERLKSNNNKYEVRK